MPWHRCYALVMVRGIEGQRTDSDHSLPTALVVVSTHR